MAWREGASHPSRRLDVHRDALVVHHPGCRTLLEVDRGDQEQARAAGLELLLLVAAVPCNSITKFYWGLDGNHYLKH